MKTTILPNSCEMIEYSDGSKFWFQNGEYHRIDGPAIEFFNGTKSWWIDGERHRENGPAIEFFNGTKHWFQNGKRHRLDGPAIEWSDGTMEWWIDGKYLSQEEFEMVQKLSSGESKMKETILPNNSKMIECSDGSKFWYQNEKRHRIGGPAIEWNDGSKEWWINGERHREDGPAIEWPDGIKKWFQNGKRHRLDGPAIEWNDGDREWWIDGTKFSKEDFEMIQKQLSQQEEKAAEENSISKICNDLSKLLQEKNSAYGSSFEQCPRFLEILFSNGIPKEKYGDALLLARMFDKMMRIANQKDAFGEDPFMDLAGYGILGCKKNASSMEKLKINECDHGFSGQSREEKRK